MNLPNDVFVAALRLNLPLEKTLRCVESASTELYGVDLTPLPSLPPCAWLLIPFKHSQCDTQRKNIEIIAAAMRPNVDNN